MTDFTRRQSFAVLAGGGAVIGAAGVGAFGAEPDFARSILHRVIGDFQMPEQEFARFVSDLQSATGTVARAKRTMLRAAAAQDLAPVPNRPFRLAEKLEEYERKVVTNFVTRTNYLRIDSRTEQVAFLGQSDSCISPFAKFDLT
ncbi:hypothetical protein [Sphingomonas panaciterrae]|uniref:hypothetical protein n=1 Tax=Sphingomonas panaciterrae TaxID=1462999 RepID=UPI002FF15E23